MSLASQVTLLATRAANECKAIRAWATSTFQPLDADLTAIAALASQTTFGRALLTTVDAAGLRSTAGLGTAATQAISAFDAAGAAAAAQAASQPLDSDLSAIALLSTTSFGRAFLSVVDAAGGRTYIGAAATSHSHAESDITGLVSDLGGKQPLDSDLTAIAALTTTTFGRALLTQADAAATRTTLGLAAIASSGSASDLSTGTVPEARLRSGIQAASVQITNFDSQVDNGWYMGSSTATGAPHPYANWFLEVINLSATSIAQRATEGHFSNKVTYVRRKYSGGAWSAWAPTSARALVVSVTNVNTAVAGSYDGVSPNAGDLVLLVGQTTASQNGLYVYPGAGVPLVRIGDADFYSSVGSISITAGTANGGSKWATSFKSTDTIGTTAMNWAQGSAMIGEVKMWPTATAPIGWLFLDGAAVSRTTYAALFALLGTTYGAGNGSTTFNVPNMQGRVAVGVGTATATGATAHTLAQLSGEETHVLAQGEVPNTNLVSSDGFSIQTGSGGGGAAYLVSGSGSSNGNIVKSGGGGGSHNNMQPYLGLNFIIKF